MFCPNCGTQNVEMAQACAKCGFQPKAAAAVRKFKGTMLMMNQPGAVPGAPPHPSRAPAPPAAPMPATGGAASGTAIPAIPSDASPDANASGGIPASSTPPRRLKRTIVGVAPQDFGAKTSSGAAPDNHTFGSAADANPLAATMALGGPPDFSDGPGAPIAFGAPDPRVFGSTPPPLGAPSDPAGFGPPGFGPPEHPGGFGGPPSGGFGPPPGGDIYGAPQAAGGTGMGGHPSSEGGYGAPPPAQDFSTQMNHGFQQVGQVFGPAVDQFGNALNGNQSAIQPYQGGNPMQGSTSRYRAPPGAMTAASPPKQFMITLLLAIFAGGFGAHRFYTGHILYGVLQLLTVGGCGMWALFDIIMIATGKYTDAQGRPLAK